MTRWLPPKPVAPSASFRYDLDGRCTETVPGGGLTIIDHFAGVALAGLLQNDDNADCSNAELADAAFNIAEAMAAERHHRYG